MRLVELMDGYVLTHRTRAWVPTWLWRLASICGLVVHVGPLRRALTEPVPYEQHGSLWIDPA